MNLAQTIKLFCSGTSEGATLAWESRDHGGGVRTGSGTTSNIHGPALDKAHAILTKAGFTFFHDKKITENNVAVRVRVYKAPAGGSGSEIWINRKGEWEEWKGKTQVGKGEIRQLENFSFFFSKNGG